MSLLSLKLIADMVMDLAIPCLNICKPRTIPYYLDNIENFLVGYKILIQFIYLFNLFINIASYDDLDTLVRY